jgi:hypothetical protein
MRFSAGRLLGIPQRGFRNLFRDYAAISPRDSLPCFRRAAKLRPIIFHQVISKRASDSKPI